MPNLALPQYDETEPVAGGMTRRELAAVLARRVRGEVLFARHARMLYATDASIYQVEPIGVVIPRSVADAEEAMRCCLEHGVAVLPRGGGTSLAGQAVNHAVVIDFSRHCGRILKVDAQARSARVEPGVVLDDLNEALATKGLMFGPDVATSTHANIGGMIGNNSSGAHSVLYGRTVEHLRAIDVLLGDGRKVRLSEGAARDDATVSELTAAIADVVRPLAEEIRSRFPRTKRNVGGYNLDIFLRQLDASSPDTFDRVNLASLVCGSEGTLAATLDAEVNLVPVPARKGLVIAAFSGLLEALRCVPSLLELQPAAIELLDRKVLELADANAECRRYLEAVPMPGGKLPGAALYVEFFGRSEAEMRNRFDALRRMLPDAALNVIEEPRRMLEAWKLRKSGEPLLYGLPGRRKPLTFIEDTAVDPDRLVEYVEGVRAIIESHGTDAAFYAHASVGCLHIRPLLDLRDAHDLDAMQAIAGSVAALVLEHGGSVSGEHGDGRLRSHLLERVYGPAVYKAFRAIKRVFDPRNLLNPGNIVEPLSMVEHLRLMPGGRPLAIPGVETFFQYRREHGFAGAVEMCNGAGVCRKTRGGTMCPSYRATLDERHATRGRGNALRLAITGQLADRPGEPQWNDPETLRTLDLCLSCKACKAECPSNVDLARLKAEYLAQSYRAAGGAPFSARLLGHVRMVYRLAAPIPAVSNALIGSPIGRALARRFGGIDPRRRLPRIERNLLRWFRRRHHGSDGSSRPTVLLFADCFTVYNEPELGRRAIEVLEALGYRVVMPDVGCCGRAMISNGLLPDAIRMVRATARGLRVAIDRENPVAIVGCEPSCISALADDWTDLRTGLDDAFMRTIAERTALVDDFVAGRWDRHPIPPLVRAADPDQRVLLHGHCHQKALWGPESSAALLRRVFGDALAVLDSGCCGMAGAFGYTADHYKLSMRIGEQVLFPAVRQHEDAEIAAAGTSCRHQVADGTGRRARHPIELFADHLTTG